MLSPFACLFGISSKLSESTGLKGGGLYHHLKELLYAGYVSENKGPFSLTNLGRQLLIAMALIARQVIVDRGHDGLGVSRQSAGENTAE